MYVPARQHSAHTLWSADSLSLRKTQQQHCAHTTVHSTIYIVLHAHTVVVSLSESEKASQTHQQ